MNLVTLLDSLQIKLRADLLAMVKVRDHEYCDEWCKWWSLYEWEALCQSFIGLIRHENASHCALILANEVYKEEED